MYVGATLKLGAALIDDHGRGHYEFTTLPSMQGTRIRPQNEPAPAHYRPKQGWRSGRSLFAQIQAQGYRGGYSAVTNYIRRWRVESMASPTKACVPLSFELGEAFQFDWSDEVLVVVGRGMRRSRHYTQKMARRCGFHQRTTRQRRRSGGTWSLGRRLGVW